MFFLRDASDPDTGKTVWELYGDDEAVVEIFENHQKSLANPEEETVSAAVDKADEPAVDIKLVEKRL